MTATPSLEQLLATSEAALASRLRFLLPDSAKPGSSLFSSHAFSPTSGLVYFVPPVREELCAIAGDCVRLRKKLSLPIDGTLAQTLLESCSGSTSANGAQRRLADLLLASQPVSSSQSNSSLERP